MLVAQPCPASCDPMDCSLQGSSVHGILQAGIPEWVAIPFSRGPSQPRDQTQVCLIAGRFFTVWATREALYKIMNQYIVIPVTYNIVYQLYTLYTIKILKPHVTRLI